jgi:hypothetical protein
VKIKLQLLDELWEVCRVKYDRVLGDPIAVGPVAAMNGFN